MKKGISLFLLLLFIGTSFSFANDIFYKSLRYDFTNYKGAKLGMPDDFSSIARRRRGNASLSLGGQAGFMFAGGFSCCNFWNKWRICGVR